MHSSKVNTCFNFAYETLFLTCKIKTQLRVLGTEGIISNLFDSKFIPRKKPQFSIGKSCLVCPSTDACLLYNFHNIDHNRFISSMEIVPRGVCSV